MVSFFAELSLSLCCRAVSLTTETADFGNHSFAVQMFHGKITNTYRLEKVIQENGLDWCRGRHRYRFLQLGPWASHNIIVSKFSKFSAHSYIIQTIFIVCRYTMIKSTAIIFILFFAILFGLEKKVRQSATCSIMSVLSTQLIRPSHVFHIFHWYHSPKIIAFR